ncbi:probable RNA-directed DNA polymerase from transposon X-element [Trichonephila clavipes]|nr:probable RNA-directed DNA polymerase from transposon X-element [Trichonephila clavipes]
MNNFISTPPSTLIDPALPDEIIHYIVHVNNKKAPEPFLVASIYAPPNPNYRNLSADLDTLFKIFKTAIEAGDYNAKHTSWGCVSSDPRGNYLLRYITNNKLDLIAPPNPTRYGFDSASTIDYALIKNLNWPCIADSLAELSSDHNPIRLYFPRTPKFVIPPPQLNTTWSIFTKILTNPENFDLPKANSTQEIDSQVSNLTTEILNAHASASRPFYQSEQPYVQGELKGLIKERNKARKTWQQSRHPQHKTELNRLQNIIKRKIYHYRQQAWEDNLLILNAEDNSL